MLDSSKNNRSGVHISAYIPAHLKEYLIKRVNIANSNLTTELVKIITAAKNSDDRFKETNFIKNFMLDEKENITGITTAKKQEILARVREFISDKINDDSFMKFDIEEKESQIKLIITITN